MNYLIYDWHLPKYYPMINNTAFIKKYLTLTFQLTVLASFLTIQILDVSVSEGSAANKRNKQAGYYECQKYKLSIVSTKETWR